MFNKSFNSKTEKVFINETVFRIVETDQTIGTIKISKSLDDQNRLEELIDETKPVNTNFPVHYLISTPFRYPPLKWGSRFGTILMNSYFYASHSYKTCLIECAYYRFKFLNDLVIPFEEPLNNNYLLFTVKTNTASGLDLTVPNFKKIFNKITDPDDYTFTHKIGKWAVVENDFNMIKFPSARHKEGINFAVADIKCIKSKKPKIISRIACISTNTNVVFEVDDELINIDLKVMETSVSM